MIRLRYILTLFAILLCRTLLADEGMWLPSLMENGKIEDMNARGLELGAADLYSADSPSLKDAIVRFAKGCTGGIVSDEGLLMTNHHCGYRQIQSHSSLEHDYLTDGFVARDRSEELPNPGLVVSILKEMRDVTAEILDGTTAIDSEQQRREKITANIEVVSSAAVEDNHYQATVEPVFYGNQYYLFIYEVFEDVRLVFAPPTTIGAFGGDTDNWMWPRHSGDFSVFRIYADSLGRPAKYSPENIPYTPAHSFEISLSGIDSDDFTFVYGFPARTYEYLHSEAVRYTAYVANPHKIALRTLRLKFMNAAQDADPEVRIKYAAKNSSVSNAWKKWQGESKGLVRLGTVEKKQTKEAAFEQWATETRYSGVTRRLGELYAEIEPYAFARDYYNESVMASEIVAYSRSLLPLTPTSFDSTEVAETFREDADKFYKDYVIAIDSSITRELLVLLQSNIGDGLLPEILCKGLPEEQISRIYGNTIFTDSAAMKRLMSLPAEDIYQAVTSDPLFEFTSQFADKLRTINARFDSINALMEPLYRLYMQGLREMEPDKELYPDANSTLRIAYGKILGYAPRNGVYYKPQSTLRGVIEKDDPDIRDYKVPGKLKELYENRDYGRYGRYGEMPVDFIATNHTSGGNSGSPVLNGKGELIGLNFDRTWEGTMSDMEYDPEVCRNISVDIRYVLFIIDKFGGAGYLLDEMKLKGGMPPCE